MGKDCSCDLKKKKGGGRGADKVVLFACKFSFTVDAS